MATKQRNVTPQNGEPKGFEMIGEPVPTTIGITRRQTKLDPRLIELVKQTWSMSEAYGFYVATEDEGKVAAQQIHQVTKRLTEEGFGSKAGIGATVRVVPDGDRFMVKVQTHERIQKARKPKEESESVNA